MGWINERIFCDSCDNEIFNDDVMIMVSVTRDSIQDYFHQKCFLSPLIDRVCKELKENRDMVVMALFVEKLK